MYKNTKSFKNVVKIILILISVIFVSCSTKNTKHISSKLELRQLIKQTETKKHAHGSFFLIAGSYNSREEKITTVKVFANVEGRFRFIEMPINKIRFKIDNDLEIPNIEIEYWSYEKFTSDETIVDYKWSKMVYVINCPSKYLPEKLLPISL